MVNSTVKSECKEINLEINCNFLTADIKTTEKLENNRELLVYRSTIEDDDNAKGVIESWREIHMFNDMAFRGAVRDKMNIRIRDIQKMQ